MRVFRFRYYNPCCIFAGVLLCSLDFLGLTFQPRLAHSARATQSLFWSDRTELHACQWSSSFTLAAAPDGVLSVIPFTSTSLSAKSFLSAGLCFNHLSILYPICNNNDTGALTLRIHCSYPKNRPLFLYIMFNTYLIFYLYLFRTLFIRELLISSYPTYIAKISGDNLHILSLSYR
jgi:hypothetical protein